ncbi:MAG: VOC family protein [Methylomonas sp.]|nr:VOC family protein [Methylomonas sp.]
MNQPCNTHGAFSWCELLTTDTDAAKQFYGKLFNWALEPAPISTPEMEYTLVKYASEPSGGMMKIPASAEGMAPQWGVYVTVDDVDATAKLAVELGGKICLPPQDIPQVGRFCVVQDPQGAVISIITYVQHCD